MNSYAVSRSEAQSSAQSNQLRKVSVPALSSNSSTAPSGNTSNQNNQIRR
jgi:hypothetical protein